MRLSLKKEAKGRRDPSFQRLPNFQTLALRVFILIILIQVFLIKTFIRAASLLNTFASDLHYYFYNNSCSCRAAWTGVKPVVTFAITLFDMFAYSRGRQQRIMYNPEHGRCSLVTGEIPDDDHFVTVSPFTKKRNCDKLLVYC